MLRLFKYTHIIFTNVKKKNILSVRLHIQTKYASDVRGSRGVLLEMVRVNYCLGLRIIILFVCRPARIIVIRGNVSKYIISILFVDYNLADIFVSPELGNCSGI